MFDKKNKSAKQSTDRAPITVQSGSIGEMQRQQIEQNLASLDPTWDGSECHLSVPIDAATQEQLGQLVSMFPNGEVTLQTTSGDNIVMSRAGYSQPYGAGHSSSSKSFSSGRQDDTEQLPKSQRD